MTPLFPAIVDELSARLTCQLLGNTTQSSSLLAMRLYALQDTPSVKSTYSAVVRVPEQLTALMSAVPDEGFTGGSEKPGTKTFKFDQVCLRRAVVLSHLKRLQPPCPA